MITMFKIIDKNIDKIINKPFYLCKVDFRKLTEFVKSRFNDVDFTKFNQAFSGKSKVNEDVSSIYRDDNLAKEYENYLKNAKIWEKVGKTFEQFKNGYIANKKKYQEEKINDITNEEQLHNFIFDAATENNFISLYSENVEVKDNEMSLSGVFYLMDGFRRLLFDFDFVEKRLDKEVYVKVYDSQTTDQDMMKLIFHFNLWKFPQGLNVWLDRGWRFFLYRRLGIEMIDYSPYEEKATKVSNHFNLLDHYLNSSRRYGQKDYRDMYSLLTSPKFYDDLYLIDKIVKKTNLLNEFDRNRKDEEFAEIYMVYLGKERLSNNFKEMKLEYFEKFLMVNINELNKIKRMCVQGHYEKVIDKLITSFFNTWSNDAKLQTMMNDLSNVQITELPVSDFINSIPKEIIEEFKLECMSKLYIEVKKRRFHYRASKIYTSESGVADSHNLRIYIFFGNYIVYKKGDSFIIHDMSKGEVSYHSYENKGRESYRGNKEGCLIKIKEMTGKDIKLNLKQTEFIGGIK